MKRELHFRMGRGRVRERQKAFSPDSVAAACRFVGLTEADTAKLLSDVEAGLSSPYPAAEADAPVNKRTIP